MITRWRTPPASITAEAEEIIAMEPPVRQIRARPIQVLILYYSRFGVLRLLAERIAQGARTAVPDADVECAEVEDTSIEQLRPGESEAHMQARRASLLDKLSMSDALIVGSPAYFGSMASPVKRLFEDCLVAGGAPPAEDRSRPWRAPQLRDKVGAAFTASATPHGGNEQALQSILTLFMHLGMLVVTPGQSEPILEHPAAPYGATAVTGASADHMPTVMEQDAARALGQRVARLATWLRLGRTVWEQRHAPFETESPPPAFDSRRGGETHLTA
jgi:NAD(P)H dehydrogenase (quinone)